MIRPLVPVIMMTAGVVATVLWPITAATRSAHVAYTEAGAVRGESESGVLVFRGIPYAAAPIGELRFRPPAAAAHWTGERDARDFLPACPQLVERDPTENNNSTMSEDCLSVNVWTPGIDGRKRPVMVFIHGGAFIEGSARNSWYDGAALARRGNVVVVTLQYRLGALGFLELKRVGGDDVAASGNLGILDQIAALHWLRRNIAGFGGDPTNVTLFGESVGATSVAILMAIPQARGLFQKAILESNSGARVGHDLRQASEMSDAFMRTAGVSSIGQLRSMRWQDVLRAQERYFASTFGDSTFGPTWDGIVIAEPPMKTILSGRAANIPVLLGTNLDEVRYWTEIEDLPVQSKPRPLLHRQLEAFAGSRVDDIIGTYVRINPDYGEAVLQLETDVMWRMPAIRMAEALCEHQPVYMYMFTYRSTAPNAHYGSAHAMELPFVFGGIDALDSVAFTGRASYRRQLMDQVQSAWLQFVRNADPTITGRARWPRYNRVDRQTMELGATSRVLRDPYPDQRKVWDDIPFDNETPSGAQVTALLSENGPNDQ
jgi:para-nitrobenzyl esterase